MIFFSISVEAQNRRYDLEQIEREEFRTDSDSANISDNEVGVVVLICYCCACHWMFLVLAHKVPY